MKKFYIAAALAGFWIGLSGASIAAENSIKQIQVRRDGDQVLLKVQMSAPLKAMPGNWSVVEPPRVVIDFPDTDNQSGQTAQQVATGDLKSLNLVQTDKLTRLVLNLYRSTKFSTEIAGDALYIKLQAQGVQASQEPAPSVYSPTLPASSPTSAAGKPVSAADSAAVREIVFRRGAEGQGTIIVDLTDGTVPIDIRRTGTGITVELRDVELPARLQNRRDVNDFATPVTTITSRALGNLTRLDIAAHGRWIHQAHLANNQLIIEIRTIAAGDANKLVPAGQQGQKVSINFFNADATMVLRTLAEISGKNVMIDPSLNGRTITANLDNVPYDQALEIIMTQASSGMRVYGDIVFFGDRLILQKREVDAAEELARRLDNAVLETEVFKLNYLKPSEFQKLLQGASTGGSTSTSDVSQTGSASGAATVNANVAGGSGGGSAAVSGSASGARDASSVSTSSSGARGGGGVLLSVRGKMFAHDDTKKLFVTDTQIILEKIREMIREMDIPPRQVMIEARIVEASTTFANSLGVRLRLADAQALGQGGYQVPGTGNMRAVLGTTTGFSNVDTYGAPTAPGLARSSTNIFQPSYSLASAANIGLMLFNNAGTKLLALELQAAEQDSRNKTISSPRIVTLNRKAATINNTQQVTILTGVNATTGLPIYQTFSAPLTLGVTPSISPDDRISLELNIAKSTITNATTGSLDTNTVTTNVIVENGGTVVIGGFVRESEIQTQDRVPFLGDLPYVGFLFKTTAKNQSRSELLIFITPRVVTDSLTMR